MTIINETEYDQALSKLDSLLDEPKENRNDDLIQQTIDAIGAYEDIHYNVVECKH